MIARPRGSLSLLAFAAALTVGSTASAQEQAGYAANHIDLSERGSRWFVLDSVDIQGNGRLALGVVNDYSFRSLVHYNSDGNAEASMVRNQYVMHLGGSIVLADRVRIGVGVPLQLFADGNAAVINGVGHRAAEDTAVGDVRVSVDGRIFGSPGDAASLAVGVALFAPSGSTKEYTGDGKPRVEPRAAFAGRMSSFAYAAKLGVMFRGRDEAFGDGYIGHSVTGALSAGVLLADDKILIGPEFFGSTVVSDGRAFESKTTPIEALLGAHINVMPSVRVGVAGGLGLTRGYGVPVGRGLLSLEWVPGDAAAEVAATPKDASDRDGDGVADSDDACGYARGVASADPAKNGCPVDGDGDGVPDDVDACVGVAGPATTDPTTNGCPQDTDKDGVADNVDACPQEAGKRSDDPKMSGCPDRDKDGDGVLDNVDACPDKAGVRTADPKSNGCPNDPDRDHDGVLNDVDACPDEAGKADADPKKSGCPKAFLQGNVIKITDQVKFKTNSADIATGKDSEDVLNAVLNVMKAHPEVKAIRVEGHTDNRGDAARNKKLSQSRAEAVAKWLETHGIDKARLSASGFGQEKPLDSNDSETGRTNNRRVEFHVEQGSGR